MSVEVFASQLIAADRIKQLPANPNAMTEKVFQRTVRNIQEEGFVEPLYLARMGTELRRLYLTPDEDGDGGEWFMLIGGHHRYRAGLTLDMDLFPAIVKDGLSDKQVKAQCARMNRLKGKVDVRKLLAIYEELSAEDGDEFAADQMALMDQAEVKRMMRDARESLPEPLREKLDARSSSIGTVDDLTRAIAEILAAHGDTVPNGYLLFEFGSQTHWRIETTAQLKSRMEMLSAAAVKFHVKLPDLLSAAIASIEKDLAAIAETLPPIVEADYSA